MTHVDDEHPPQQPDAAGHDEPAWARPEALVAAAAAAGLALVALVFRRRRRRR